LAAAAEIERNTSGVATGSTGSIPDADLDGDDVSETVAGSFDGNVLGANDGDALGAFDGTYEGPSRLNCWCCLRYRFGVSVFILLRVCIGNLALFFGFCFGLSTDAVTSFPA
jgi:hypothetical protein